MTLLKWELKGVLERDTWNNWEYRITESYHQPSKKQTTPNYCYINRSKKCIWRGSPPLNAKSVRISAEVKTLITDYYDNYAISVGTGDYSTETMILGTGVLLVHYYLVW